MMSFPFISETSGERTNQSREEESEEDDGVGEAMFPILTSFLVCLDVTFGAVVMVTPFDWTLLNCLFVLGP